MKVCNSQLQILLQSYSNQDCGIGKRIDKEIIVTEQSPEIYPHKYYQLFFDKRPKAIQWNKDSISADSAKITGYPH